jgi:hypothetical protein
MALLFIDGFDHSGTTTAAHTTKWTSAGNATLVASPVRTGTGAMRLAGAAGGTALARSLPAPTPPGVVGFAFQKNGDLGASRALCVLQEGAIDHVGLGITPAGLLFVFRGTTATVLQTGTTALLSNTWYYLEFKATIHDTAGLYEVRLDGVTELSAASGDTRNGGTGAWTGFYLNGANSSSVNYYFDDVYCADSAGSVNNTFLGAVKVETLLPQTDAVAAGSNTGLTPSTGTDHGALVDENPPNTTDYNSSATVGLKDTYHYPSLSLTGAILGVQTNLYVAKSDAAARQVCAVVRTSSTDYDGANVSPSTTFGYVSEVRQINPATGAAWTAAEVDALEAGMKVTV